MGALFVIGIIVAVLIGLIVGIVKLIKIPSPPPGSSRKDLRWWYEGGWRKTQIVEGHRHRIEEETKKPQAEQKANAQRYLGLSFTDIFRKTMTLTADGVEVSRTKGAGHRFYRVIPYSDILETYHYKAKWWRAGFFSLITIEGGVAHAGIIISINQAGEVSEDEGTVSYRKRSAKAIRQIIDGIQVLKD